VTDKKRWGAQNAPRIIHFLQSLQQMKSTINKKRRGALNAPRRFLLFYCRREGN
jgi:hypothetical protein